MFSPVEIGYQRKQGKVTKRVTRLSMMLRYHAPILADIDIVRRTENPRADGSTPSLGTKNSRCYVDFPAFGDLCIPANIGPFPVVSAGAGYQTGYQLLKRITTKHRGLPWSVVT